MVDGPADKAGVRSRPLVHFLRRLILLGGPHLNPESPAIPSETSSARPSRPRRSWLGVGARRGRKGADKPAT